MSFLIKNIVIIAICAVLYSLYMEANSTEKGIVLPVDWLTIDQVDTETRNASNAVGEMYIPNTWSRCTGFFISPKRVVTANHCVRNRRDVNQIRMHMSSTKVIWCNKFIKGNRSLDYSIIECDKPNDVYLPLAKGVVLGERLKVIHFNCDYNTNPRCKVEKLFSLDEVRLLSKNTLMHKGDTLPGSSGAPILNSKNEVIGVHHSSTVVRQEVSNYGLRIDKLNAK